MSRLKQVKVNFSQRKGAYWITVILVSDTGEMVLETEADHSQIVWHLEDEVTKKDDLN